MSRGKSPLKFIPPQVPTLIDEPPEGSQWIHEVKHDGYRTQLVLDGGEARAFTRNGHNWTSRYSAITGAAAALACRSAIIDGEVVVQDGRGVSDFEALQKALSTGRGRLVFYGFDLLHLDGEDLRNQPLLERRSKLARLLGADDKSLVQFSQEFVGDAAAFFGVCAQHGLEGIVSKYASSRYRSGRSKTWLKTKCFTESELTLVGIDRDRKTGAERALLARQEAEGLVYAGAAFLTLGGEGREALSAKAKELAQERPILPWMRGRKARWVRPEVILKVKHLAGARRLRHATVKAVC